MRVPCLGVIVVALAACSDEAGPSDDVRFVSLAAGGRSACGLTAEGEAFCWGANDWGQLGTGDAERRLVPSPVAGSPRFTLMDQGTTACAVDGMARPFCWGAGSSGVAGNGAADGIDVCGGEFLRDCNTRPQAVRTEERFREVVNNGGITCGLTETGLAYCWGMYQGGYLGIGVVPDGSAPLSQCRPRLSNRFFFEDGRCATEPVPVRGDHRFRSLAAGAGHVCGAAENGDLLCWARPAEGDTVRAYVPTVVEDAPAFVQLSGGQFLFCGVTAGGAASCWESALPFGGRFSESAVGVGSGITFSNITVGDDHACGTTPGGTAYCWGVNDNGQLGDGTTTNTIREDVLEPTFVSGGHRFRTLAAGTDFTCGITFEADTYCWGANTTGQLGNGRLSGSLVPVSMDQP